MHRTSALRKLRTARQTKGLSHYDLDRATFTVDPIHRGRPRRPAPPAALKYRLMEQVALHGDAMRERANALRDEEF